MELVEVTNELTMTLKEITDLLNVRHNDAMVVVERMSEEPEFGTITKISYSYKMPNGGERSMSTYQLNKRQSIAVAAKLNTSLLMRIIDRWQELEQKQQHQFQLPDFTNPAEAAIAWAEQWKKRELAEQSVLRLEEKIEQDAPKLEVYEAIAEADSGIRITEFARVLSDKHSIGRNKLYSTLRDWKLLDRNNVPYQRCIEAGWFYVVERPFNKGDYSGINFQIFLTGKGQSYIINRLKKENII